MHPAQPLRAWRRLSVWCSLWLLGLAATVPAHGFGGLLLLDPAPTHEDRLSVGASAWSLPSSPGSAHQRTWVLPGIDYYATSGVFVSTDDGVGWNGSRNEHWQVGARAAPYFGRGQRDANADGLPAATVGTRVEQALFCNYAPNDAVLVQSTMRHGMGRRRDSVLLEAGATSGIPLPAGELLGITLGSTWANGRYKTDYFGSQTRADQRFAGGWQDLQAALSLEHRLGSDWRIDAQWLDARLVGAASRSALTQSRYQRQISVALWRTLR